MSLIDNLIKNKTLKSPQIIKAFQKIKRKDFVLSEYKDITETDIPFSINFKQTISQPTTVAFMFELLQPKLGDKILDIGSGSGWTVALLSEIVGKKGYVYGMERINELVLFAKNNINKYSFIKNNIANIFNLDGYNGLPDFAPFDKIIVAATAKYVPKKLLEQLKVNGRLVMPIGEEYESQNIVAIDNDEFAYNNAVENIKENKIKNVSVLLSDVEAISNNAFDVILANINKNIILNHLPYYAKSLNKDGVIVVSGLLSTDAHEIKSMAEKCSLKFIDLMEKNNWVSLKFIKKQ